jgi:hypothetical protein
MPVRGQCCGDSSQAAEEPMSALDGQQPRDLHDVLAVPTGRGPHAAALQTQRQVFSGSRPAKSQPSGTHQG